MANAHDTRNPSARLAPAIDRGRPTLPAGRRRMLGLAAGAAAIATTSAQAAVSIDEPLEELWHERERLDRLLGAACEAACEAEDAASKRWPPRPPSLYLRKHGTGEYMKLDEALIQQWLDQSRRLGIGVAAHEKQLRTWNDWRAACDVVDASFGIQKLDQDAAALAISLDVIDDQIIATPARSMRGVLLKLKLIDRIEGYGEDGAEPDLVGRLVLGLISDIEAATGGGAS